jgi:hypothetical protein
MLDLFELVPATRIGVKYPDGAFKSERHFLDFAVNGQSLWEKVGKPRDLVSVICYEFSREETIKAANRLLLTEKAVIPADRRSLFVCSECGDIGCGAVTALVVREGHSIVWKDFGFENSYENHVALTPYDGIGPFVFDAVSYKRLFLQGIESLAKGVTPG